MPDTITLRCKDVDDFIEAYCDLLRHHTRASWALHHYEDPPSNADAATIYPAPERGATGKRAQAALAKMCGRVADV